MLAIGLVGLLGVLLLGTVALSVGEFGGQDRQLVLYTVTRGDLPITVVERGNLDSQEKVEIYCEIENLSYDRSGSSGTQILSIIPNGESVKKGDLLVEFDAAALQDRLDSQVLALERARAEKLQAEAAKNAATRSLEKEQEKFDKYTEQLTKCKIYAPQAGMVAYAMPEEHGHFHGSSSQLIAEGAFVRERQKILTLPSLTKMEVKTSVHESVLDQVKVGLKATIRLDAFVDRTYRGTVKSVAVMPDQGGWLSSDTKVYSTVVSIDQEVQGLKPGMTAVVEINVERLKDVLSVPVQAIVQVGSKSWCYAAAAAGTERRDLTLGKSNDKFVEIVKGLQEGDRVALNPMAIVDESQKASNARAYCQPAVGSS